MIHIFLGAPGGGKTTQAKLLVDRQDFHLIAVGELLRQKQKDMPDLQTRLAKGNLADLSFICQLLDRVLRDRLVDSAEARILLDGFPRSKDQADWLIENWRDQLRLAWVLELDPAKARQRLGSRGRYDDQDDVIDQRWRVYQSGTPQALAVLREDGLPIITVDADQPIEAVHQQLIQGLEP